LRSGDAYAVAVQVVLNEGGAHCFGADDVGVIAPDETHKANAVLLNDSQDVVDG